MVKKLCLVIAAIAAIAVVASLSLDHGDYVSHRQKFDPAPNLNPKYFVVAHGHIALSLLDKVNLSWKATYISHNPKCQYYPNSYVKFEGVPSDRAVVSFWKAQADAKGDYQLKIPLDKYLPGYCQWSIFKLYFSLNNIRSRYVGAFASGDVAAPSSIANTFVCVKIKNKLLCKSRGPYKSLDSFAHVSNKRSYDISLNVRKAA